MLIMSLMTMVKVFQHGVLIGCIVLQEILKFIILVRVRLRKLNRIGYTEKQLL